MSVENVSQEFRLKNINETRNYFIEEINQNKLMSKKHKKVCRVFNYIERLLILVSKVIRCVSISAFASLVGITAGVKIYKPLTKEKKKKHDKIVFLATSKLNSIEVLISKALIDSNISYHEFVLINSAFKEYDDMKEEIKNSNNK